MRKRPNGAGCYLCGRPRMGRRMNWGRHALRPMFSRGRRRLSLLRDRACEGWLYGMMGSHGRRRDASRLSTSPWARGWQPALSGIQGSQDLARTQERREDDADGTMGRLLIGKAARWMGRDYRRGVPNWCGVFTCGYARGVSNAAVRKKRSRSTETSPIDQFFSGCTLSSGMVPLFCLVGPV